MRAMQACAVAPCFIQGEEKIRVVQSLLRVLVLVRTEALSTFTLDR